MLIVYYWAMVYDRKDYRYFPRKDKEWAIYPDFLLDCNESVWMVPGTVEV